MKFSLSYLVDLIGLRRNRGGVIDYVRPKMLEEVTEYEAAEALKCPPVAISMKEVIQAVSTQPVIVKENKAIENLFKAPNPYQSWQELHISASNSFLLYGASYLHVPRAKSGTPLEILELPADQMKPVTEGGFHFEREDTGETFGYDEVCFIRDFLGPGFEPLSRLSPVFQDILAINNSYKWINEAFDNSLKVKHVVSFEGKIDDKRLEEIKKKLLDNFGSSQGNPGGFIVVDRNGKVTPLKGLSPADADLQNFLQAEIRVSAAVFGAPPFSVGSEGDTKYSNHSAEMARFLRSGIAPVSTRFADALSRFFKTPISFDEKALYFGDLASLVAVIKDLVTIGVISRDEGRELIKYASIGTDDMKKPTVLQGGGRPEEAKVNGDEKTDDDTTPELRLVK